MTEDKIDQALKAHFARTAGDAGVARVMEKLAVPLPQQKRPTQWPQILLDWQFAPAWPRLVALAGCAALGFAIGSAGLTGLGESFAAADTTDLAFVVFEPEPLTGLRP